MQIETIQTRIYEIKGIKVMFDFDIAELYEVETRILNQAVKRNSDIFPKDFMFQLTLEEWNHMSSQIVMTYPNKRPKKSLPYVFTEHGVTMLSTILKSKKARQTSVSIVRAFVALKQFVTNYNDLDEKMQELETTYNKNFEDIYEAINYLLQKDKIEVDQENRKRIGY